MRVLLLTLALAAALPLRAQNMPHIGYVYPAGGRAGTSFQVVVGGQYLAAVSNAFFSGDGVQATVLEYNRPMNQKEFMDLRDKLKELQDKRQAARQSPNDTNTWTTADEKQVAEIRAKIAKNPPNRQGNPAIAETITLQVTLATNAPAGTGEIRLGSPNGLSNPMVFCVGQLPEFSAPPARAENPERDRLLRQFGGAPTNPPVKTDQRITLPAVVNGQITPGAVDRFHFTARRAQELVIVVSARQLIPYLADAVPGWFQATVALLDAQGRELAYDDDFRFHPDPVLHLKIPRDGEYRIEIKDAIYRGREDFVYRITLGELPFITSIFPLGGPAGKPTAVELKGWNLPVTRMTNEFQQTGVCPVSIRQPGQFSNRVPFATDTLPEAFESEPNNAEGQAQSVTLPVIVNGRIGQPGDVDAFVFTAPGGAEVVAEVLARRLDSPLDSALKLTDAAGRQIAFNDDHEDKASGLNTHHADSYLRATLPAAGKYFIQLSDTQRQGGGEYAYRLRLSPPRPDFALRVVPSSLSVRPGLSTPVTVFALRQDGFTNEITLSAKDAPAGFTLSGSKVPAGEDQVRLTLSAPALLPDAPMSLSLEGAAVLPDQVLLRPALPADDMMQAFAYRHLVLAQELMVTAAGNRRGSVPMKVAGVPVRLVAGGTARVQVSGPRAQFLSQLQLELSDPPEGITLGKVTASRAILEVELRCDAVKAKPGRQGNLIINVSMLPQPQATNAPPRPNNRRAPVGTLPAIPFEILDRPAGR